MFKRFQRSPSNEAPARSENISKLTIPKNRRPVDFAVGINKLTDMSQDSEDAGEASDYHPILHSLAAAAIERIKQVAPEHTYTPDVDQRVIYMLERDAFIHFAASYASGDSFGIANRGHVDEHDLLYKAPLVATGAYLHVPSAARIESAPPFIAGFGTQDVTRRSLAQVACVLERFSSEAILHDGSVAASAS